MTTAILFAFKDSYVFWLAIWLKNNVIWLEIANCGYFFTDLLPLSRSGTSLSTCKNCPNAMSRWIKWR